MTLGLPKKELEKLEDRVRAALQQCDRALKQQPQGAEPRPVLRQMAYSGPPRN